MTRAMIPAILLGVGLMIGCSQESNSLGDQDTVTRAEQNEEAASIIGESIALESGGALEAIEYTIDTHVDGGGFDSYTPDGLDKSDRTDDAVFDSTTCTWTLNWYHAFEGPWSGFEWEETRTVHFMDEEGGCIVVPPGDGSVKAVDFTREFSGSSWNRRHRGEKAGTGDWESRELHDEVPGAMVNGEHHRAGEGEVYRNQRTIPYDFSLDLTGTDLRVIRRDGRRIPIEGTIHIYYLAHRGNITIEREVTITFGDGGGVMVFDDGDTWNVDPLTGEISQ